jgi:hypothetical protein
LGGFVRGGWGARPPPPPPPHHHRKHHFYYSSLFTAPTQPLPSLTSPSSSPIPTPAISSRAPSFRTSSCWVRVLSMIESHEYVHIAATNSHHHHHHHHHQHSHHHHHHHNTNIPTTVLSSTVTPSSQVYPGAIMLNQGTEYQITHLDVVELIAHAAECNVSYYTKVCCFAAQPLTHSFKVSSVPFALPKFNVFTSRP